MMRVGVAADHGGFALKEEVATSLRDSGYDVADFGAPRLDPADDYPDFIILLARLVAAGRWTAEWRSAAVVSEPRWRRTKCPASEPDSSTTCSPPIRASKMTT